MTRLDMVPDDTANTDISPIFDRLRARWGGVLNLYRVLAWAPAMLRAWTAFAWALRFETNVSRKLRELLILRSAQVAEIGYEWTHHLPMALKEGISANQIADLADWQGSESFSDQERLILRLADEVTQGPGASLETIQALKRAFSNSEIVELLLTVSVYVGLGRFLHSLDVDVESDHSRFSPRDAK